MQIKWLKTDQAWSKISQKLWIKEGTSKSVALLSRIHYRALIAAASVSCLLALGGLSLWVAGKMSFRQMANASTIVTTCEGEKSHIFLADSTKIFLNSVM